MPLALLKEQVNTAIELFDTFPLLVYPCRIYDHQRGAQGQLRYELIRIRNISLGRHLVKR